MARIWITGARGMLGQAFCERLRKEHDVFTTDILDVNIASYREAEKYAQMIDPEYIINCAAYTSVDLAERELDSALNTNRQGAENMAEIAKHWGAQAVHFGTDYVFNGEKTSYAEIDLPHARPLNNYGFSKLLGELRWNAIIKDPFIVRSSWVFSHIGNNFVTTMLKLFRERDEVKVVNDQLGRPTYAPYLADVTIEMLFDPDRPPGCWHVANGGICSWHRLAEDVYRKAQELDMLDHDVNIIPVTTAEYMEMRPEQAERPPFSVLETKRVEKYLNKPMKHYRASLAECMLNIKEMEEQ